MHGYALAGIYAAAIHALFSAFASVSWALAWLPVHQEPAADPVAVAGWRGAGHEADLTVGSGFGCWQVATARARGIPLVSSVPVAGQPWLGGPRLPHGERGE